MTTPSSYLTPRDAWLLESFRAGAPPSGEPESELAKQLYSSMVSANGQGRDAALNDCLATMPKVDQEAVRRALLAVDPSKPPQVGTGGSWASLADLNITWAWQHWLPNGFLIMIAGEQGSGKSALALAIGARYLLRLPWPDGTPYEGLSADILWLETEAAQAVNLARARAWGLKLDRIHTPFPDPFTDVRLDDEAGRGAVRAAAESPNVGLVVVDSLRGAHRGKENDSESIGVVLFLAELARDTNKPVIAIHHLRKAGMGEGTTVTLDRLRGSSAMTQPARLVWAIDTPDPAQPSERRLSVIKSNISKFPTPRGFTIDETGAHFGEAPEEPHTETQTGRACDLLLALLRENPRPQQEIQKEAEGQGISVSTLRRAKEDLHVVASKQKDTWYWGLPSRK